MSLSVPRRAPINYLLGVEKDAGRDSVRGREKTRRPGEEAQGTAATALLLLGLRCPGGQTLLSSSLSLLPSQPRQKKELVKRAAAAAATYLDEEEED